jgi:protoporphyrinogen oxidase
VGDADESVDSFFHRRLGSQVSDNLVSAFIHGVYAGDATALSIKAIFPSLSKMERDHGSVLIGSFRTKGSTDERVQVEELKGKFDADVKHRLERSSVWSLQGGLETFAKALHDALESSPNVDILKGTRATAIVAEHDHVKVRILVHRGSRVFRIDEDPIPRSPPRQASISNHLTTSSQRSPRAN